MSEKVNEKLKKMLENKYQTALTDQEVFAAEQNLVGFFRTLIKIKRNVQSSNQ